MINTDRLELIDTGDGVPLSKCEQNLYEVLACQEDGVPYDPQRIYDAFEDMNELVAEVWRLQRELDTQYGYIEWLEEFAPKAGDYNTAWDAYDTAWDAYELAKGIHWTQMEEEE